MDKFVNPIRKFLSLFLFAISSFYVIIEPCVRLKKTEEDFLECILWMK